jgi:hypothetical protein
VRMDRQILTKLIVAFLNFSKTSKNIIRQGTSMPVEIYRKVHDLPSKFGNFRLQEMVYDGPDPLARYALLT